MKVKDIKSELTGLTHGRPETGFFVKRRAVASRFGEKPGFFDLSWGAGL